MSIRRATFGIVLMLTATLVAVWFMPSTAQADYCDPWQACDRDSDCSQGVCINTVCQCGGEEGRPICGDRCPDRGLYYPGEGGGDTVHISDCRGIASGNGGGVISYCEQAACVPNAGQSCSASNSCGMSNGGTISCGGSCDASPPSESLCGAAPFGWGNYNDCTLTGGWAFDPDYAGSIPVRIYRDGPAGVGTLAGTVTANVPRPDVHAWALLAGYAPPNRTNTGWQWTIPASLKDGLPHTLYSYAMNVNSSGTLTGGPNPLLSGSPITITCSDPPTGSITGATCGNATGNAIDPQGTPVNIRIYDGVAGMGGVQIGTGTAGPGFSINFTPFTNGQTHTLYAYAQDISSGTWYQLSSSAAVSCAPTVSLSANPTAVDPGQSSTISWVVTNAVSCTPTPASGWFNAGSLSNGVANSSGNSGALISTTNFSLACSNQAGTTTTGNTTVTVNIVPPTASITSVNASDYCTSGPGMVVNWHYTSPSFPIASYQVQVLQSGTPVFDTGQTPYSAPGSAPYSADGTTATIQGQPGMITFSTAYTARVRVWDSIGTPSAWTSTPHTTLAGPWPAASFTNNPATPTANLPIQFTDTSAATPTAWLWNFGDGGTDTTQNPQHPYAAEGAYNVTLWATNSAGTCSVTKALGVQKALPIFKEVRPGSN